MKIINYIGTLLLVLLLAGCDDSLADMGGSMIPDKDQLTIWTDSANVSINSLIVGDSIYARSSVAYLGKYTDPDTNTKLESDFLAQLHCRENFEFPNNIQNKKSVSVILRLYFDNFFGDSLNSCKLSVYPLSKVMDDDKNLYTNLNPEDYYDSTQEPIATKTYTASDHSITDSARWSSSYYANIPISLPTKIGTDMINKFYETNAQGDSIGKEYFKNPYQFINNINKGYYVKCERGDGTILYIDQAQLEVYFNYFEESKTGLRDSLVTAAGIFGATNEVVQANKFKTAGIKEYVDKQDIENNAAVIRTPVGVFAEVTIPVNSVSEKDSLNSAQIVFRRYNDDGSAKYKMNVPSTLLMVRKKDMYTFFEKDKVYDNITSFIGTFVSNTSTSSTSTYNSYAFNNIANLIRYCQWERNEGLKTDPNWESDNPDWNKVVLIPITYSTATTSSSTAIVTSVKHDLQPGSVCLKKDGIKLKLIYSTFNK